MRHSTLLLIVLFIVHGGNAFAATILTPVDSRTVSDASTTTALNTVNADACCNGTDAPIRSRADTTQDNRQVATFLQFDVSSLSVADVNNSGFSAEFRIDYTARLNTTNNQLSALVGRNQGGPWDSLGSNNPLHDWGFNDDTSTIAAADSETLVNITSTPPPVSDITVDVSDIVKGWVEGSDPNWGFVVFYDQNSFQGAGFDDPELLIAVPEPSTFALAALGLLGLIGFTRRKR